ncbi:MAG: hypothetical protein AAF596_03225, partial [Planctomycetota bacterium]
GRPPAAEGRPVSDPPPAPDAPAPDSPEPDASESLDVSSPAPGPPAANPPPSLPRLRIQHLMLWTAVSAVLLVVSQTGRLEAFYPPEIATVRTALAAVSVTATAACFTVIGLLAWWRRSLGIRLVEPGHAIALLTTVNYLFRLPLALIFFRHFHDGGDAGLWWLELSNFEHILMSVSRWTGGIAVGVLAIVISFRSREGIIWRAYFLSRPVVSIVGLLSAPTLIAWLRSTTTVIGNDGWQYLVYAWPSFVLLFLLAIACFTDSQRRHWTHWWGVLAMVAPTTLRAIWIVVGISMRSSAF